MILEGHFQSTRSRFAATRAPILVLHDTTEFTYSRSETEGIGILNKSFTGRAKKGRPQHFTVCGILMHSSLAVTTEGLPLGLTAIKFWTRSKFKGTNALKRKINPTRVPIEEKESIRWLENLRQSTALLVNHSAACISATERVISMNSFALPTKPEQAFSYEPAWTDLPKMENKPSPQR